MNKVLFPFILIFISTIYTDIFSQAEGLELGDILWQVIVPNQPGTSNLDKQIRSLKQIQDVNGDNVNDVIAATGNYWTICYNGVNGEIIWQYSTYFGSINTGSVEWEDAVEIADINIDGIKDVVIGCGGGNEMVYAINGLNGSIFWAYGDSIGTSDGDIESVKIKYDYNGDGNNDVLVSASGVTNGGRHALICLNSLNGQIIFYRMMPEPFTDDVVPTASGGAIGVNNNTAPYRVAGFDILGNPTWSYSVSGNIWSLKEVPDISNDNNKDIIGLCGFTGTVFGITANTGSQVWVRSLGSSNNGKLTLLDDADGNGYADFTLSAPQSAFRCDTKTGSTIWSIPLSSSYIRGVDNLGDITGDTTDDIVMATQVPARLIVLNGLNGNLIFNYDFGSTLTQRGDRTCVIADMDSNGVNEFLGGNREGRVICFYGGNGTITSVSNQNIQPNEFKLYQNYPNPFNPSTDLKFSIHRVGFISLKIYNNLGDEVSSLVNERKTEGHYRVRFNAEGLSSGIYFYTLLVNGKSVDTKKMLLLK